MSYADEVRAYCAKHIVEPARSRGETEIAIRSGDVHDAMGYTNRLPLVCSALGTGVFEEQSLSAQNRRRGVVKWCDHTISLRSSPVKTNPGQSEKTRIIRS